MDNHFPSPTSAKPTRCLLKSLILDEWWLVKSYNGDLGVGGFNSTGTHGVRTFCSTPIAKRLGATTVETMDGITVTLVGSIDRPKTLNNGFPPEVAYHFHNGFPYYWEKYAPQCSGEESRMPSIFDDPQASSDNFNSATLFDLPVSRMRGLSVSSVDNHSLATEIFKSVLEYYGDKDAKDDRENLHESCSTSEENLFKRKRAEFMPQQTEEDQLNEINGEKFLEQMSQPETSPPGTKSKEPKLTASKNEVYVLDAKERSVKTPKIKLQPVMKTYNTQAQGVLTRSRSRMMNSHRNE